MGIATEVVASAEVVASGGLRHVGRWTIAGQVGDDFPEEIFDTSCRPVHVVGDENPVSIIVGMDYSLVRKNTSDRGLMGISAAVAASDGLRDGGWKIARTRLEIVEDFHVDIFDGSCRPAEGIGDENSMPIFVDRDSSTVGKKN